MFTLETWGEISWKQKLCASVVDMRSGVEEKVTVYVSSSDSLDAFLLYF